MEKVKSFLSNLFLGGSLSRINSFSPPRRYIYDSPFASQLSGPLSLVGLKTCGIPITCSKNRFIIGGKISDSGWKGYKFTWKLEQIKNKIKMWNKEVLEILKALQYFFSAEVQESDRLEARNLTIE